MNTQNDNTESMDYLMEQYLNMKAPLQGLELVKLKMKEAEAVKIKRKKSFRKTIGTMAAVLAFLIILPNTNENIAKAMSEMPVIGKVFDLVTFREYQYQDERHEANVKVPEVIAEDGQSNAADQVNKSVQEYTDQAIKAFQEDVKENEEGYQGLDISYETVTDSEDWFVLKVDMVETQASGYETAKYYNINKKTDTVVTLKELFVDGTDYVTLLTNAIKTEMRRQMKEEEGVTYFIDDPDPEMQDFSFQKIKEDQNFYINSSGQLVISFDEYEVAPGSMGRPEFIITDEAVLKNLK